MEKICKILAIVQAVSIILIGTIAIEQQISMSDTESKLKANNQKWAVQEGINDNNSELWSLQLDMDQNNLDMWNLQNEINQDVLDILTYLT